MKNLLKYGLMILAVIASTGMLWAGPYIEVIHDTCVVERIDSLRVNVSVEQVVNACCDNEHSEKTGGDKLCIGDLLWVILIFVIVTFALYLMWKKINALKKDSEKWKTNEQKIKQQIKSFAKTINQYINQDNLSVLAGAIFVLMLIAILVFILILLIHFIYPSGLSCLTLARFGVLGDFFGGFIGTFVAAIVAIYAIRAYKSERELQKAGVISDMLTTMLNLHRQNVNEIKVLLPGTSIELKGRDAFKQMYGELFDIYEKVYAAIRAEVERDHQKYAQYLDEEKQMKLAHILSYGYFFYSAESYVLAPEEDSILHELCEKSAKKVPDSLNSLNRHVILGHYYRHLYNMVNYIDKNNFSNDYKKKEIYVKLIRSQLSDYEEMLLYYDSLSLLGKEWNKPLGCDIIDGMNLICKYRLLKNCPNYMSYFGIKPSETYQIERAVWDETGELFFETDPQGQYEALQEMLK